MNYSSRLRRSRRKERCRSFQRSHRSELSPYRRLLVNRVDARKRTSGTWGSDSLLICGRGNLGSRLRPSHQRNNVNRSAGFGAQRSGLDQSLRCLYNIWIGRLTLSSACEASSQIHPVGVKTFAPFPRLVRGSLRQYQHPSLN